METTAVSQLPMLTETGTNAIEVFMYDVAEANDYQAGFFNSVAKFANNIIDAIASTEKYFTWVNDIADAVYNGDNFPIWFGSCIGMALFFLLLNFIRNR